MGAGGGGRGGEEHAHRDSVRDELQDWAVEETAVQEGHSAKLKVNVEHCNFNLSQTYGSMYLQSILANLLL